MTMTKKIVCAVVLCFGLAAVAWAAEPMMDKNCGAWMTEKAALPGKMSEVMTAVADMMDSKAALLKAEKTTQKEAAVFKKLAVQHRKLAAEFKKTEKMMNDAG